MKITYTIITIAVIALIGVAIGWNLNQSESISVGSVQSGSEYHATTTYQGAPQFMYLDTGVGSVGSIVVTKAGSVSTFNYLWDATTTNSNLRGGTASTSIMLAAWPGNMAAGTYTFDQVFYNGLILENVTGTGIGSTTVTFKP